MARLKANASARPTDLYNETIAGLEEAAFTLVEMTVSVDRRHAERSAFTLLNRGEVGLGALGFGFDRVPDPRLRLRIIDLLRGACFTHGASVLKILGRIMESDDLDPLLRTLVRSSLAEVLDRTARGNGHRAAGGPAASRTSDQTSADPASEPGK
jgi:hypothetical protein